MIRIENMTYRYRPDSAPIFEGFSWQVAQGEHWTILGPSGGGKTTLLKLIAGLRLPESGHVRVAGQVLARPRPATGLILQDYGLLPWATVWQNVALGWRVRRFYGADGVHTPQGEKLPSRAQMGEIVAAWLKRLGLWEQRRKFPNQLSGGQRQRVAIARTLALKPDLLLMDEPFNSLDAAIREGLQDLVLSLRREFNMTTVIVTHALDEAAVLGTKILVLSDAPQTEPIIIENPAAAQRDYRTSAAYLEMRNRLRDVMGVGTHG